MFCTSRGSYALSLSRSILSIEMQQLVDLLKNSTESEEGQEEVVLSTTMYEEWPMLEFPDLGSTILDLFTRNTSELVSASLLQELSRVDSSDNQLQPIRLSSDEQLRWTMQIINHSLSLSFSSTREYETVRNAVSIYLRWLRALTDVPDPSIPAPLLDTPEKYFRTIVDALRGVFCRRIERVGAISQAVAIDRQAVEIETILDSLRSLTESASRKYRNEVWARSLGFLLNSADLLLSEPSSSEEMGMRVGSRVVDTLFELWFRAVVCEEIPSPSYWRTLSVLCRRWRHHVTVIESWARKLLSLTVLVCRKMYGEEYSRVLIHDDSIIPFGSLPLHCEEGEVDLLYHTWYNMLSLLGSPVGILSHDPTVNKPIHGGLNRSASSMDSCPPSTLPLCFFLATTAIQRMVDVFYGDPRVPIEFKESDILIRKWAQSSSVADETLSVGGGKVKVEMAQREKTSVGSEVNNRELDSAFIEDGAASVTSSVSATTGRSVSDMTRRTVKRQSDRSSKQESVSHAPTARSETGSRFDQKSSVTSTDTARPAPAHFVAHTLTVNPAYPSFVGQRRPKSERVLAMVINWLLEAAMTRQDKPRPDITDDVISCLSLHSVDLEDAPDAMNSIGDRTLRAEKKRTSFGSASSSITGEMSTDQSSSAFDPLTVDGVSAGRAAALAALTRIVCSKSTGEKLPTHQLAGYFATVHQALVEKDRIVLCALFYYGHTLFRLGLPAVEAILPHFLFALDIILIESSKLRLHPSIHEVEMRRCCLRALTSVVCWPTTFGMSQIPQLSDSAHLKSSAATHLHLRSRVYKTLVFSLRNEIDATNLQMTIAMCTVLMEESCSYDLGLSEEQTEEMVRITTNNSGTQPEKGLSCSLIRGLVSAVCDRICRPEWAGDHSISLSAIDLLNALSHVHLSFIFSNKDVSTGGLIVASLCRFIEAQLLKPPPLHSKDLHSTVVAAYNSIAVWLCAAPMLAECVGVLSTVTDCIQLGVTGNKPVGANDPPLLEEEKKSAPASKRVLEAAEHLMYSLFCNVGRGSRWLVCDERRLLYLYGPSAIDTTRFQHFLVNGDTLLSMHEASHITTLSKGCPCVIYVRRSPMQAACVGVARLRPHPDGHNAHTAPPPTPQSAVSLDVLADSKMSQKSGISRTSGVSSISDCSGQSISTGSILSGVPSAASIQSRQSDASSQRTQPSTPTVPPPEVPSPPRPAPPADIGRNFTIPTDFFKMNCKLDTMMRVLEPTAETNALLEELKRVEGRPNRQQGNVWTAIPLEQRVATPKQASPTCDSVRVLLYDMGLIDREVFGTEIVQLDSGQSADFYRDLHDMVDSCPSRSLHTAHIFYVKEGQRSAVDILDNALNIQNTSGDFCSFLSGLGEGIEIGVHDSWTGHWSTAYSSERKPLDECEAVDHYIIDGVSHALWWADAATELAFLMPTERSLRLFKQDLASPAVSSRRGSTYKTKSNMSVSSDDTRPEIASLDSHAGDVFLHPPSRGRGLSSVGSDREGCPPYGGGGSSMGNSPPSRRSADLRVLLVWLERAEDLHHFPVDELLCACDDGGDRPLTSNRGERPAHVAIFIHLIENGLVQLRTRGSPNRFGEAGPLIDGMVVSLSSLPSFVRLTLLNISRRNVAEIENYQFTHTKRKQAIVEFGKKYAANLTYEDFLIKLVQR